MLNENLQFNFSDESAPVAFKINLSEKAKGIHDEAIKRAGKYLVSESELLEIIIQVDLEKVYEDFGEFFLTPYCVKYLKLDPDVAANFVRVARRSHKVPELKAAIDEGKISVTEAKVISSVITSENQQEWIDKAENLTKHNLEKEVAKASPKLKKPEKAKPQGSNRVRVEFELSEDEMALFRRAQDLVSQKLGKSASLAETQKCLLEVFLEKQDPIKKAERAQKRSQKKAEAAQTRNQKEAECSKIQNQEDSKMHRSWDQGFRIKS